MDYNEKNYAEQRISLSAYTSRTFGWMFFGLMVTFILAYTSYSTGFIIQILSIPYVYYILPLAEIALVIWLSSRIHKISIVAAQSLFFVYALLNGLTFAVYFLIYDVASMIYVFSATAGLFGIMAVYGYFTKRDLSKWRTVLFFGLITLIGFWIFSMFINLSQFETIICALGIVVFVGFTAYDTQKIKAFYEFYYNDTQMLEKASILSALQLYLDFINLFIYLLRFLGRRK